MKSFNISMLYLVIAILFVLIFSSVMLRIDFLDAIISIWFFRILLYIILSALIVSIISVIIIKKANAADLSRILDIRMIICSFLISFFFVYNFLSVTAFTNQRSYTIFSLAELYDNSDKVYTQAMMEQVFIERFVLEGGATKQRIDEQLATGYIERFEDGYRISNSGRRFIELLRFLDIFFPIQTDPSSLYPNGKER